MQKLWQKLKAKIANLPARCKQEWHEICSETHGLWKQLLNLELSEAKFLGIFYYGFTLLYIFGLRLIFPKLPDIISIIGSVILLVYIMWILWLGRKYYYLFRPDARPEVILAKKTAIKQLSEEEKAELKQAKWQERKQYWKDLLLLRGSVIKHDPFNLAAVLLALLAIYQLERIMKILQNWYI